MADKISKSSWVIIDRIIKNALEEDIGSGDITTNALTPEGSVSNASLTAKSGFILAGLPFAKRTFELVDRNLKFRALKKDGGSVKAGTVLATIKGSTSSLLTAERTALNILQRLSGIATLTNEYVKTIKGLKAGIADTRKTAPGLRFFDKYAVKTGKGTNHRFGLFDGVLIKDNHIAAAGGIARAVKLARCKAHHLLKIEVEVKNLKEVREAVLANADIIMLDNMQPDRITKAVDIIRNNAASITIEASGNVSLKNVRRIAETGIDLISIGALTHSAPAADISLNFKS
ncbi:MAG TPA: carboxylating nicotinate-nucleotide diphosphorylase [Nitrospirae bacterium]|nr:carboxylating nicotinate-nucleotide diphosphorylase [Nitrospirota bacterium]